MSGRLFSRVEQPIDPILLGAAEKSGFFQDAVICGIEKAESPVDDPAKFGRDAIRSAAKDLGVSSTDFSFSQEDEDNTTIIDIADRMSLLDTISRTGTHTNTIRNIKKLVAEESASVAEETGADLGSIVSIIRDNAKINKVEIDKTADKLKSSPNVSGFDPEKNFGLDDSNIRQFLIDVFGHEKLIEYRAFEFVRLPYFLVSFPNTQEVSDKTAMMKREHGMVDIGFHTSFYGFPDYESYVDGAKILEEEENPDDIRHSFRNRAISNDTRTLTPIRIGDHGIERPKDFEYLSDLTETSEQRKRQLYLLGSIAHEVAHSIQDVDGFDVQAYREIAKQDEEVNGKVGVTSYAQEYFAQNVRAMERDDTEAQYYTEDFAESMRIYVTNHQYLKRNFPARFNYIAENCPWIKPAN